MRRCHNCGANEEQSQPHDRGCPSHHAGRSPEMPDGYCYEWAGDADWRAAPADDWDIVVYRPTGDEVKAGERTIDDTRCVVFSCPDGKHRGVNRASVC